MGIIETIKARVRGVKTVEDLEKLGFTHGKNLHVQEGVIIDWGHSGLITVGDDVTLAPRVHILAHDASTKIPMGCTKIAEVKIGNRVFIGAGTIVLPGVTIGDDVIVGAGSIVTKSLPGAAVYVGSPAKRLMSIEEYIDKEKKRKAQLPYFGPEYTVVNATPDRLTELKERVSEAGGGFII